MADTYLVDRFDPARLREVRTKRGLSQEKLAERVGQKRVAIVAYENRRQTPRAKALIRIAQALDVDITELLRPGSIDMTILRMRRDLSQADVAAALGVSRPWYQRIEARRVRINPDLLPKLATILAVDEKTLTRLLDVR